MTCHQEIVCKVRYIAERDFPWCRVCLYGVCETNVVQSKRFGSYMHMIMV